MFHRASRAGVFAGVFAGLVAGVALAVASAAAPAAGPDGLYSTDQLIGAPVYIKGSQDAVGDVDDVLLDNGMRIQSFIVEANGRFGLGGKSYVVAPDQLSVATRAGDKATEPEYRITLSDPDKHLDDYPFYDDAWWTKAQNQASDAWAQTRESAGNVWTQAKRKTNEWIDRAQGQAPDDADANAGN